MNWYSAIWYWWSFYSFIPFVLLNLYRLRNQESVFTLNEKALKSYKVDTIFRLLLSPMVFYYSFDSLYILMQYDRLDACNFSFLSHHLVTLAGLPTAMTIPYYTWFLMAPVTWHGLLIVYPYETWLNYPYLAILMLMAYGINQKPWRDIPIYQRLGKVGLALLPTLAGLWLFSCKNDMTNVI